MKTLITMFAPTLSRIPQLQNLPNPLHNIRKITNVSILDQRARLVYLTKLISEEVKNLQDQTCVNLIESFTQKYDQINYDYDRKKFVLQRFYEQFHLKAEIKSAEIQQFDHPFFRGTLYFHEIKDADKYFNLSSPKSFPKYLQDQLKKMQVSQLLDQTNPLGIPYWSKSLIIQLTFSINKSKFQFLLQSKLGKTIIKNCSHYPQNSNDKVLINPKKVDSIIQEALFNIIKNKAEIKEQEFQMMNSLKFIGGAVEKIQIMLNIYEKLGAAIQRSTQINEKELKQQV